jgi:tetratricopeptide (TPR) repeat protein
MSKETLRQAVGLIESGEKEKGCELLKNLAAREPENEDVGLWLAACGEGETEKKEYIEKVLAINPNNENARQALAKLLPVRQPSLEELVSLPGVLELLEKAAAAEAGQDYERGYKLYNQAIKVTPDHPAAWLGRGRCTALLNAIDQPRLGEAIESICKGKELGGDGQLLTSSAYSLALSLQKYVKDLEDFFKEKQLDKIDELSSPFYRIGFGGALSQTSVDKIAREQNQKFQIFIPSLVEGLTLAWELTGDKVVGKVVLDVVWEVDESCVLSETTKKIFKEKINFLLKIVKKQYPELIPEEVEKPKKTIWYLVVIILILAALIGLAMFINK